jgi:hypothetical protein
LVIDDEEKLGTRLARVIVLNGFDVIQVGIVKLILKIRAG